MADTLPLRYAQSLLRLAPVDKAELAQQLRELNLPQALLSDRAAPNTQIAVEDYGRLFIHLVHRLQSRLNQDKSTSTETTLNFSAYRMLFQAMLHAGNLQQAMQRASVYFARLHPASRTFCLHHDGETTWCRFDFDDADDAELQSPENFDMEVLNWLPGLTGQVLSMAMWHRVCGWLIGAAIDLQAVEMTQATDGSKDYRDVFGVPVEFACESDGFAFHSRYLDFPVVQSEASLDKLLETYPAELFRIDPATSSTTRKVKQLIGSDFQRDLPTLQDIADRLHMTTPTLHRRLREEGTSYQQLKDNCRTEAALAYLASDQYTTAQLSELLGFSDSSTFHRAFKKWTGKTPTEYRNSQ